MDILLSSDGGLTYPISVLANTLNDGSQTVTVPNNPTTTARIKIKCADNIFFDISDANFTITASGPDICTTYPSSDVPKLIDPPDSVNSTVTVPTGGDIDDVNVLGLNGTHTWINDLSFNLSSPTGTNVEIMAQSCNSEDDFNLNLDDEAAPGAWPCPPTGGGTYQPTNPLSTFDGENSAGTWTLVVTDNFPELDSGQLDGWSLEICAGGSAPSNNYLLWTK